MRSSAAAAAILIVLSTACGENHALQAGPPPSAGSRFSYPDAGVHSSPDDAIASVPEVGVPWPPPSAAVADTDANDAVDALARDAVEAADGSPGSTPTHHHALAVAIGDAHACALRDDHTVRCWGEVAPADRGPSRPVVAVAAGGGETCAILADGSVTCWSATWGEVWSDASLAYTFGPNRRAASLAMGERQSACAVLDDGSARCWNYGQTGPSATESTLKSLVPPDGAPRLRQLALGWEDEVISLYADGTIGEGGQLVLTSGRLLTAQPATTIANVRGDLGWCATFVGNGFYCWGLGNQVPSNGTLSVTEIALAEGFACALRTNGTVSCWGASCGDGDYWCKPGQNVDRSYDVALGQPAVSIATGTRGAPVGCAVLVDGSVKCWSYSPPQQCNHNVGGEGVCQAIVGTSVEVVTTSTGGKYGAWHPIDLDDPS